MRPQDSPLILICSVWLSLLAVTPTGLSQMDKTIEVLPVANAPFMAIVHVEQTRTQKDGNRIDVKVREMIARDSHGRIFRDFRPQTTNFMIV